MNAYYPGLIITSLGSSNIMTTSNHTQVLPGIIEFISVEVVYACLHINLMRKYQIM